MSDHDTACTCDRCRMMVMPTTRTVSKRVLHEWTYWDPQANGVSCSVEGKAGNPYQARVLEGSEYQLALEILRLAAENAKLRACVKAADEMRFVPAGEFSQVIEAYDAARAEVDEV